MGSTSNNEDEKFSAKVGTERCRCANDSPRSNNRGQGDDPYSELWHSCAGPMANVPHAGDMVFYFPQGHIEQVEAYTNQDGKVEMPIYNLPSKILCKVVNVQLKAEAQTDEVFAQITLLPELKKFQYMLEEEAHSKDRPSAFLPFSKSHLCSFSKRLTPSDTSTHGGFSVPKRQADECFPPLDKSRQPYTQELVAKDLHGCEWHFRHIYRGQPKRHLLTSGWSTFVGAKKLVAGDSCTFVRGENGELYIGARRVTKPQNKTSASVISSHSMQHGILASAFHAISTGTMFTVYYRPWTSPSEFIIPYDKYMKLAENEYSIGMRFRMEFEDEEELRCLKFAGTVIGIENFDSIRWPGSEWRCLKVQWDTTLGTYTHPERVSPWSIEPIEVRKKNNFSLLHKKRSRSLDQSAPEFPVLINDGLLKNSLKYTPERHSGVLQGQEIRNTGAHEPVSMTHSTLPHLSPQKNPNWSPMQIGLESQLHIEAHNPFYQCPSGSVSMHGGFHKSGIANFSAPIFSSHRAHDSIEVSKSLSVPNINSISSVSQDWKAPEEKDKTEFPLAQLNGSGRCMLFGVNILNSTLGLPSPQEVSSSEFHSVPPASPPSVSEPPKSIPGNLIIGKNCSSTANRSCTKVQKCGTALGRSVDLARFDGHDDLICELDQMFDFKGALIDGSAGWHVTYTDGGADMIQIRDHPWPEFRAMVQKLLICPKVDADKLDPSLPRLS